MTFLLREDFVFMLVFCCALCRSALGRSFARRVVNLTSRPLTSSVSRAPKKDFDISCFYEELPTSNVGMVVSLDSATLAGHPKCGIHTAHSEMVKFMSDEDIEFVNVCTEIQRLVNLIIEVIPLHS